jgi:hypothetical protein
LHSGRSCPCVRGNFRQSYHTARPLSTSSPPCRAARPPPTSSLPCHTARPLPTSSLPCCVAHPPPPSLASLRVRSSPTSSLAGGRNGDFAGRETLNHRERAGNEMGNGERERYRRKSNNPLSPTRAMIGSVAVSSDGQKTSAPTDTRHPSIF